MAEWDCEEQKEKEVVVDQEAVGSNGDDGSAAPVIEDLEDKKKEYEKVAAKWGRDLQLDPSGSNPRSVRRRTLQLEPVIII